MLISQSHFAFKNRNSKSIISSKFKIGKSMLHFFSPKMHLNFFPLTFFFFFLVIFIVVHIPVSLCSQDSRYDNCTRLFQCGNITAIGYPFWGNDRPDYCGRPGFELKCKDNYTEIQIMSQRYRILSINQTNKTLKIARIDLWDDICPAPPLVNTTLNSTLFDFSTDNMYVSLFYGCPTSNTSRAINGTARGFYSQSFWPASALRSQTQSNAKCNVSIIVPVLKTVVQNFDGGESAFQRALWQGFGVTYLDDATYCKKCGASGGRCGYNSTMSQVTCFCPDGDSPTSCSKPPQNKGHGLRVKIAVGVATGMVGFFIIIAVIMLCYSRRKHSSDNSTKRAKSGPNVEAFLKNHGTVALKRYNYSNVKKMANSFKEKLGEGGYGGVFKGKLLDGRMVAVKVLSETKGNGEEFINEVASISRTSHVNIVALLGFCVEGRKRALIYEFMSNGSLEKFLYDDKAVNAHPHLGWEMLYQIAIGIARGLEYLHRGCNTRILHFDIKPHNILLDQDFCPKISDFGLAKLCLVKDSIISMTGARGTPGYIAPELVSRNIGGVSHKSDVYSYGMMVLEMVGGRKNMDLRVSNSSKIYFPQWIYRRIDLGEDLGLHGITSMEDEEIAKKMILVGLWCIQIDPLNRPPMNRVLEMLEENLADIQIPPKPFMSSPSREQEPCSSREEECSSSTWQTS